MVSLIGKLFLSADAFVRPTWSDHVGAHDSSLTYEYSFFVLFTVKVFVPHAQKLGRVGSFVATMYLLETGFFSKMSMASGRR